MEERKQICVDKQWKFTKHNGEVVVIRDSLQKVVEWIHKFREVGDVVMQFDPVHAALPWAGVDSYYRYVSINVLFYACLLPPSLLDYNK